MNVWAETRPPPGPGARAQEPERAPCRRSFYAADGAVGAWRRQAGALQPAFARTIAHDPALRELVDAGKAIKGRLLDLIRVGAVDERHLAHEDIAALTPAKLRRLGSFDLGVFGQGPCGHVALFRALSKLPMANVPDTSAAWRNFMRDGLGRVWEMEVARIPLASAFRDVPRDWDLKALWPDHPEHDVMSVIVGIADMTQRCGETLIRPFYGEIRARDVYPKAIAKHLLFRGDSFARMTRRQRAWASQPDGLTSPDLGLTTDRYSPHDRD